MAFGRGKKWEIDHFIERPEVDGVTLTAVLKSVDGTETRTVHTGKQNERDARAFAQDWLVRLRRKPKIRPVKKLIREYADRCHQRGVRASTLEAYWQSLAPFARHVGEDLNIRKVKREDIEGYLLAAKACGRNGKPRSAASVNKIRRHLSAFFKWCRISGYMGIDPAEGASRFPETPKHSVEMTQRDAAAIDEELDQLVWKTPVYLWRFLWWSGVRLGSALELRWDMVNLEAGELEIPPTSMKARRSFQVPLHPLCLEALREWNKEAAVEFDFPDDRPWGVVFPIPQATTAASATSQPSSGASRPAGTAAPTRAGCARLQLAPTV